LALSRPFGSNSFLSQSMLCVSLKPTANNDARKLSNGDLRDDRPPHGWGGRASKDGLAARRGASAMAHPSIFRSFQLTK